MKVFLLLAVVASATLRSCTEPRGPAGKGLHRPGKIDSVAFCENDRDSLKIWDVTDSLRDPKERFPTTSTRIFQTYDHAAWRTTNRDFARIADSLGVQYITKADFDGNGQTDMLVSFENQPLVMLDDGRNQYRTLSLTLPRAFDPTHAVLRRTGDGPEIWCYYFPWMRDGQHLDSSRKLKVDTLVYYKGDFIEKNARPIAYRIEHIHIAQGCSQMCIPFDLDIDSVGKAIYISHHWEDTSTTTIDRHSLADIYDLLHYIDFPRLQNSYAVEGTDEQEYATTIIYDGGKTKSIDDYGETGTRGLALLYDRLSALRYNQHWRKIGAANHR